MNIIVDEGQVQRAIDGFNRAYHWGFREVRERSIRWLRGGVEPDAEFAATIAHVLQQWGAGRHKAPKVGSTQAMLDALRACKPDLLELDRLDLFGLGGCVDTARVQGIDARVRRTLVGLSSALELHRTTSGHSVTYPTKLLLLLTGRLVGMDSNVRAGLQYGWKLQGYSSTQFLLPAATDRFSTEAQRLSEVFWLSAEFLAANKAAICQGVAASCQPDLLDALDAPARVVDIVLFMSGKGIGI